MTNLQLATENDIPTIYKLAEAIWFDHYPDIVSIDQIEYMLKKFYSEEALLKLLSEGQVFYLIINENGHSIGYLSVTESESGKWFMNKFYIKTNRQGKGVGGEVLRKWEQIAMPAELTLQVNRKNFKSVNFYFKHGFKIRGIADFDIGNGYSMDDFIMIKYYDQTGK